jgi:alkylation response protein AidB-like acyl-CoA dehydrogenase
MDMDFALGKEQEMLKKEARDFLAKECPKDLVREMMEDPKGYSPKLWKKMAELGWQAMAFPEKYDGIDSSFLDLVVLCEEMGRALLPGPFLPTVIHAGRTILFAGNEEQKKRFLPAIAAGKTLMTMALTEASGSIEPAGVKTTAVASGKDVILNGTKLFVPDAHVADYLICVARTGEGEGEAGISLFIVDTQSKGLKVETLITMTGEKLCEVTFDNVTVSANNLLGELGKGWFAVQNMLDEAAVCECAWMLGGAKWVLEATVNFVKERVQFDVPIGSFQAIQHKLANVAVDVEAAMCIVYYAGWAMDEAADEKTLVASVAKAWLSDIYKRAAFEGVQLHGGMGFTWEHDMHLYLRRAKSSQVAFGDADYHRERIARILQI